MCMSVARANFSTTKVYAGEGMAGGRYVHVVAYQNKAESQTSEPNAMILPFPTDVPLHRGNVIDTSNFPKFLEDITNASKIQRRSLGFSMSSAMVAKGGVDVFQSGSYSVILADNIKLVPGAMSNIPDDRRIALSYRFLMSFGKLYPDQPVAVCLWKGTVKAEPLLWWYEPKDKGTLFIPTMDSHDGNGPDLEARVETDHIVSVGSNMLNDSRLYHRVHYQDSIPGHARDLLPVYAYGTELPKQMLNGDMFVKTAELSMKDGKFRLPAIRRGASWDNENWEDKMYGWSP